MSNVQLVNRLIVNVCEIPGEKIKSGRLESYEWEQLDFKIKELYDAPIFVDDTPSLSVFELRTKARRLVREHGIKCIIKTVPEIIALLNNPRSEGMRILVLVKTVKNALEVYKAVPGIEYVNIGNAGRFTSGDGTERTIISRSVSLTPDEVEALKELAALAPDTALQMVPSDEKKLVSEVL